MQKNQGLLTPVVFIIFNRPDFTERVFKTVAQARPKELYVVADGPRVDQTEDKRKCALSRAIVERIDWPCKIRKNYSDLNLGTGKRVSSGLDWVFSEVEEAIVLEDDCIPTPSFFYFCQTLLEYYRHDRRIMHIGGNNFQCGPNKIKYSYFFSKYPHIWGWATWKRAWKYYDFYMKSWPEFKKSGMMRRICTDDYERNYWTRIFDEMYLEDTKDTWDYQWTYTCWRENGLAIYPSVNLVSNIGCDADATHTISKTSPFANLPTEDIWRIKHPPAIKYNKRADMHTFNFNFGGMELRKQNSLKTKILYRLSMLKKCKTWLQVPRQ